MARGLFAGGELGKMRLTISAAPLRSPRAPDKLAFAGEAATIR